MTEWISVEDRIPQPERFVLCWNGKETFIDWWGSKKNNGNGATHWMYFKEPPNAGGMYLNNEYHSDRQSLLMKYDPSSGNPNPYPSHARQYREYWGNIAWLINPWTGHARDPRDIGTDVFGILIQPTNN